MGTVGEEGKPPPPPGPRYQGGGKQNLLKKDCFRPLLVHKLLGSRTPSPSSSLLMHPWTRVTEQLEPTDGPLCGIRISALSAA